MKTIIRVIAIAILAVLLFGGVAFGQSSEKTTMSLTTVSRLDIGFGGVCDFVKYLQADSAGNWFANGTWGPVYRPWAEASVNKLSPSGQSLWKTTIGGDTLSESGVEQMVYDPMDNSVTVADVEEDNPTPIVVTKLDGSNGSKIWQITREEYSYYTLHLWQNYILALRDGFNTTVFLLNKADGSVADSFLVASYAAGAGGLMPMETLGDTLWVFANEFTAKYLLPSGELLWKIPTTDFATEAVRTYGTIDSEGNAYVCTSDWLGDADDHILFAAVKYSSNGQKLWAHEWYGWADTSSASGLDLENWTNGIAVDESLKLVVVFGGTQKAGTSGYDNNDQSAYMAFLNAANGDTLLTNKWDDNELNGPYPSGVITNWITGSFNQQHQLVLLGFGGIGYPPAVPQDNFISTFNLSVIDGVTKPPVQPNSFELSQNYPNPFNPTTTIRYEVSKLSHVTLDIYNVLGQKIATLVNEQKPAGSYTVAFDGSRLASGTYLCRLQAGDFAKTIKMVLAK